MKVRNLSIRDLEDVLELEEKMYWSGEKWHKLWEKEGKQKFRSMIKDYLINFPSGCFGLFSKNDYLLGAIIFTKLSKVEPIPYIHQFSDYFKKDGNIAYVQIFVVKRSEKETEIAEELYREAEKVTKGINCDKISVIIYSSPIEENTLLNLGYKIEKHNLQWEIYPDRFVNCNIYSRQLD